MIFSMIFPRLDLLVTSAAVEPSATTAGKWVFVVAFAILLVWLLLMPRRLIGQQEVVPPWWRNVRFWAIVVAIVQMWVYFYYG